MNRKVISLAVGAILFAPCPSNSAQQPTKIPRIGWLTNGFLSASSNSARQRAFRQGLSELGYVEGKNIVIEWRGADNVRERGKVLAEELVRLKVDVIVTAGSGGAHVAKKATSTIPIVMASADDPVGSGLVASLARPGGNITGLSQLSPELSGKRLEILKEVLPKLSRLASCLRDFIRRGPGAGDERDRACRRGGGREDSICRRVNYQRYRTRIPCGS